MPDMQKWKQTLLLYSVVVDQDLGLQPMLEVFSLPLVKLYTGRLRAPIFGSVNYRNDPYLVTHLDHGKGMFINETDCTHAAHQTCFGLPLHAPLVSPSKVDHFLSCWGSFPPFYPQLCNNPFILHRKAFLHVHSLWSLSPMPILGCTAVLRFASAMLEKWIQKRDEMNQLCIRDSRCQVTSPFFLIRQTL